MGKADLHPIKRYSSLLFDLSDLTIVTDCPLNMEEQQLLCSTAALSNLINGYIKTENEV